MTAEKKEARIRKGKLVDLNKLLFFLNKSPELQANKEGKSYTREWVKACLEDKARNLVLIAEIKGKLIGFLIAELWKNKKDSFFVDLFVISEHRRKGIGFKLKKEYEGICKSLGINRIHSLVLTTNKRMHKFMKRARFKRGYKFYLYEKKLK